MSNLHRSELVVRPPLGRRLLMVNWFLAWNLLTMGSSSAQDMLNELDSPIPMTDVMGVLNRKAVMPCDIEPREKGDSVYMVLWFKESDGEPLYSFDLRNRIHGTTKPKSTPGAFGTRVHFNTATVPAQLLVDNLKMSDEGVYRCRVDFRNTPTRNAKVNLTIIVPPDIPVIYHNSRGQRANSLEVFNQGSKIALKCEVSGGRPRPSLTWYLDNVVLDNTYTHTKDGKTENYLEMANVGRVHLNNQLVCQASNSNISNPVSRAVNIDVNLKPEKVSIVQFDKHMSAGKRYEIECKSSGSRPPANITWWKGSRQIKDEDTRVIAKSEYTISILTFTPSREDDGKYLTCRAENGKFLDSALEDKLRLEVFYAPNVTLRMGSTLNPEDIKEGDDVYFECNVQSNPKFYKLSWFHNGQEIHQNMSSGIVVSQFSLVLQGITKQFAGDYQCLAANNEGKGMSNPVSLRVMYIPECRSDKDEIVGALKQESILLRCMVDANPPSVSFHWTFNNSGDLTEVATNKYINTATTSTLNYTPVNDLDYGTLACWGTNMVGSQRVPCYYQVVAAGRPFPLVNCSVTNYTDSALEVECLENFDGGLPQSFQMELLQYPNLVSKVNVTTSRSPPIFQVFGIDTSATYQVKLYAINAKGASDPVVFDQIYFRGITSTYNIKPPLAKLSISSVALGLVITVIALLVMVCLTLVSLHRRNSGSKCAHQVKLDMSQDGTEDPARLMCTPLSVGDEDPDVIPSKYERRPLKGFMKMYKTPPQRRRQKGEDEKNGSPVILGHVNHKDNSLLLTQGTLPSINSKMSSHHLVSGVNTTFKQSRPCSDTAVIKPLHNHKLGPEVVTASHRIQESCI
uniref:Protein turtle homolog A n=2 Tax=Cacopsylla melanoneura TaxID=428564 RepID=A0A8D8SKZ5_9HEMI